MKWLFHSCLTLSRSSCRKSENKNQTHSMSKWFPKASFNEFLKKSITHAVKYLLLCDHQPCMCWLACENEQLCFFFFGAKVSYYGWDGINVSLYMLLTGESIWCCYWRLRLVDLLFRCHTSTYKNVISWILQFILS